MVSSEQFSVGGFDTVRGYLESETLGDNGIAGNIEFRSPNVGDLLQKQMKDETGQGTARFTVFNEWRLFAFTDAGKAIVLDPLPEQQSQFDLWSYGVGARFKMFNYINGTLFYSVPMTTQAFTQAYHTAGQFPDMGRILMTMGWNHMRGAVSIGVSEAVENATGDREHFGDSRDGARRGSDAAAIAGEGVVERRLAIAQESHHRCQRLRRQHHRSDRDDARVDTAAHRKFSFRFGQG